jgi:oligosaccharide repeat unit polymerase
LEVKTTNKKIEFYFIFLIIFKVLLDFSYIYYLNPNYGYMGFYLDLNYFKLIESYIFLLLINWYLPRKDLPSSVAVNVLNLLMVIPILSIYALKDQPRIYFYGVVISFFLLIFIVKRMPRVSFNIKTSLNSILTALFLGITFVVYGLLIFFNGLPSLKLLDFSKVYEVRSSINYGFNFMVYLVSWQGAIINVFLLIITAYYKKMRYFLFFAIMQLVLYLLTSHKTFLFYPLLLFFIIRIIKNNKKDINLSIIIYSIIGLAASLIVYAFGLNQMIPSMIISRVFYLPAQISFQYYEYFNGNGLMYLSHSIFSFIFSEPVHAEHPIRLIGETYYNNNWPNTGYLGDAFMNFGIAGMLVFSVFLGLILVLVDSLSNTQFKKLISIAFITLFMFPLSNMGLLTSMLTGGLLFYILILFLYREKKSVQVN